jgi:hypothetical protein
MHHKATLPVVTTRYVGLTLLCYACHEMPHASRRCAALWLQQLLSLATMPAVWLANKRQREAAFSDEAGP